MKYKLPNETILKIGEIEIREMIDDICPMIRVFKDDLSVTVTVINGRMNLFVKRYTDNGFETIYETRV